MIIAIDPGQKGAAAWMDGPGLHVVKLAEFEPIAGAHYVVEELLPVPGRSVQSTMTTAREWGALVERLSVAGTVETVHPKTWQAALRLSAGRGEAKTVHKRRIQATVERAYGRTVPLDLADAAAIHWWAVHRVKRDGVAA
jgi:hypothetical protein